MYPLKLLKHFWDKVISHKSVLKNHIVLGVMDFGNIKLRDIPEKYPFTVEMPIYTQPLNAVPFYYLCYGGINDSSTNKTLTLLRAGLDNV